MCASPVRMGQRESIVTYAMSCITVIRGTEWSASVRELLFFVAECSFNSFVYSACICHSNAQTCSSEGSCYCDVEGIVGKHCDM